MTSAEPGFFETWFDDTCEPHPLKGLRILTTKDLVLPDPIVCFQILLLGGLFTVVRSWSVRCLFGPVADKLKLFTDDYPRFFESAWQITYYTAIWLFCAYCVHQELYFKQACLAWEMPFPYQPIRLGFHWIYVLSMGWYLHCFYAHVFLDPRKKDYYEMLIHHVATFALLFFTYSKGYVKIGILALYCMDVCDIFLHFLKLFRLVDNVRHLPNWLKNISFPFLPISWVVFRIFFFVRKVVYSACVQSTDYGSWRNNTHYVPFNGLLIVLLFLQIMWFYYIMKTAFRHVFTGAEFDDERDPHAHDKRNSQ